MEKASSLPRMGLGGSRPAISWSFLLTSPTGSPVSAQSSNTSPYTSIPAPDLPSLPERSPYEVILEGGSLFVSHARLPPADWRRARFQKLLKSWSAETPLGTLQAEAALMEIVASLLRVASVPEGTGAGPDLRILGAVEEIERRLSEPLSVGELARQAGLSPSQFTRQFHALIGEPPASYARKARLHHARELLDDTDTPIKTVAFACGFRNAAHFSRAFFATFGEWPSRHRRHSRQPGAESERLELRAQEGLVSTFSCSKRRMMRRAVKPNGIVSLAFCLAFVSACGTGEPTVDPTDGSGGNGGSGTGGNATGGTAASCSATWGPIADPDSELGEAPGEPLDWLGLGKALDSDADYANRTEVRRLSGIGSDDAVAWDFIVTEGRNACVPSKIPVPSNWEFHEFGTFHYGSERRTTEQGIYRRRFEVPAAWSGKRILLVFEGSMTDTTVTVNGKSAGPTHRGAFYKFQYDVTELVEIGTSNEIEVVVAKESSDASVNEAERQADYWTFGGIFRPVYLEAYPPQSIERVAVDARADGTLVVDVFLSGVAEEAEVTARVFDETMAPVGAAVTVGVAPRAAHVQLASAFDGVAPWNAERPMRYRLAVELAAGGGARHEVRTNFGFRTVEVRAGDGIYVNGTRVMLRGVNRHSFWPESGRTLTPRLSLDDAELLKSMNVNAVRCSHYPADRHFYDVADAVGFYVLDELAGWQSPPYDEEIGRKLVEEMVTFNVNHPSILFWDNGNEGGWNTALDADFARWDPSGRTVLHPWANFNGVNTDHYESYTSTVGILGRQTIFMPTEFLHGLYDGGGGCRPRRPLERNARKPRGRGRVLVGVRRRRRAHARRSHRRERQRRARWRRRPVPREGGKLLRDP